MSYVAELTRYKNEGKLSEETMRTLHDFYMAYMKAAQENQCDVDACEKLLVQLLHMTLQEIKNPFTFEPFHACIRKPIDYYQYGLDFIRSLVRMEESTVLRGNNLKRIEEQLSRKENVVLLANHQTELDPQAISLLLEKEHPRLAEEMIFVAGHRVVSDPLAIPFSKGRNLLCIYSKKYIDQDPALKAEKLSHNQRTMNRMGQLLAEGGKCIYVAPSGGRDRPDSDGKVVPALFDPQSIELFYLVAKRAQTPTHFYPFALATYHLLPPPDSVEQALGEQRTTKATAIHIAFGDEVDMEGFPGGEGLDKKKKKEMRAQYIWEQVCNDYEKMC